MSEARIETPVKDAVFIGIYLDDERVNVSAVTENGSILAKTAANYNMPKENKKSTSEGKKILEINPEIWWDSTRMALGNLINQLRSKVASPSQLKAVAVSSVSGALAVIDKNGAVLLPTILREDQRASDFVKPLNFHGQDHCSRLGIKFTAESPLAKIAWIKDTQPELYENAFFVHQADYIIGHLKGKADVTEFSLALMTGCDVVEECWPDWIDYNMYLGARDKLPRLVHLGTKIGNVCTKASSATGLPAGISVVMGTTAKTASFLASGARNAGDFYTEIEDGMAFNGISPQMILDQYGQIQTYKLPNNGWFFSVESRTGAGWIKEWFADSSFDELEKESLKLLPTKHLAYPNVRKGETFPFNSGSAEGFISPATDNRLVQFTSCLQGTALFERYCYQKLDKLAGMNDSRSDIYSGGQWTSCDGWMQCRADVTGRVNQRMVGHGDAAFGTAMAAAMGVFYKSIEDTAAAMLQSETVFYPNLELQQQYDDIYGNFCELMEEQGYV
ncbi:sugar kinase [Planctomycetales bacterium]|nr:sugar kinase [Planctomycetales bacterium]